MTRSPSSDVVLVASALIVTHPASTSGHLAHRVFCDRSKANSAEIPLFQQLPLHHLSAYTIGVSACIRGSTRLRTSVLVLRLSLHTDSLAETAHHGLLVIGET